MSKDLASEVNTDIAIALAEKKTEEILSDCLRIIARISEMRDKLQAIESSLEAERKENDAD